ncbi:N5-glutamine methyltransferase, modifies release factors RF-1 and RF-2 [Sterolibacterium denitrificans]|uniref:Release factor glutamine methyltransferase n=2 Tax=Sterolibacterium denitrificans TaxID=157592 RepID=A0A656Z6R6_9PROT|nr:peptide chain release factor N(5)-glutamine methyltransferase [Sterolibacterium denitrificans]KYC28857.1 SAM-dependent methyltransferase [Sterolibacterium denitrificans]SMB21154.1 N5-glutamine methyltransferase, modifies release factors RF-1 and RF-2 [Sterolibacterium denitrificans]
MATERADAPACAPVETGVDMGAAMQAAAQRIGRLEARLLLQHLSGLSASALVAHPEYPLDAAVAAAYAALVARRAAGEPMAYLTGRREFYGRDFFVAPGVLIPRPETELLVELALAKVAGIAAPRILDLGCGSGCIGISLALERPDARVTALDASGEALAIARRNAQALGARVELLESDWFAALASRCGSERYHLIVSNPPYIAEADPHLRQGDLRFEPLCALASGADGLDALRRIAAEAPAHLHPAGWLLFEHGFDQVGAARELLLAAGYGRIEQQRDLAGIVRVSGGCRPG